MPGVPRCGAAHLQLRQVVIGGRHLKGEALDHGLLDGADGHQRRLLLLHHTLHSTRPAR